MHKVRCKCGEVQGHIQGKGISNRVICYCSDCQAFAKYLGSPTGVLDGQGGTEIIQVAQPRFHIDRGMEHVAIVRFGPKGLVRWYASCCKTPIGNTLSNPTVSFIGLVRCVLDPTKIDQDFGKHIAKVNVDSAIGEPKPAKKGLFGTIMRFLGILISMKIGKRYQASQLFDSEGKLIVEPIILDKEAVQKLKTSQ